MSAIGTASTLASGVQKASGFSDFISELPRWVMIASTVVAIAGISFTLFTQAYVASIGFVILLPVSILGYFFMSDDGSIAQIEEAADQLHNINLQLQLENTKIKQESQQLAQTANQLRADNQFIQQTCTQLQGINQSFQTKNNDLLRTEQGMQLIINQVQDQNHKLEAAVRDNQQAANRFEQQVALSKIQNQALHDENQRLESANLQLKANTAVIQTKVDELQGYITQIQAETASFVKAQGVLRANLGLAGSTITGMTGASTKLGDASKKLEDATKNFDYMINQNMQSLATRVGEAQNAATAILDSLKQQNDILGQDVAKIGSSLKKLDIIQKQIQDSNVLLAQLETQKASVLKDLKTLGDDFGAKQKILQDTLAQLRIEEDNLTAVTAKYAKVINEVADKEQMLRDLATAIEQASDVLDAKLKQYNALLAAGHGGAGPPP